jgi:hypothetical protein
MSALCESFWKRRNTSTSSKWLLDPCREEEAVWHKEEESRETVYIAFTVPGHNSYSREYELF